MCQRVADGVVRDDCTQDSAFAFAEYRHGRSLSDSVRDSNYIPRGEARSEYCWSTIPVHSITWNQLLGGVQPDRVTKMVAVHKELGNNTEARKRSTVTAISLDVIWKPIGVWFERCWRDSGQFLI